MTTAKTAPAIETSLYHFTIFYPLPDSPVMKVRDLNNNLVYCNDFAPVVMDFYWSKNSDNGILTESEFFGLTQSAPQYIEAKASFIQW